MSELTVCLLEEEVEEEVDRAHSETFHRLFVLVSNHITMATSAGADTGAGLGMHCSSEKLALYHVPINRRGHCHHQHKGRHLARNSSRP
jgi:hypothetical protein